MAGAPVSKAEFRSSIQEQLLNDGVLQDITASVRSRLLQSLLKENGSSPQTQRDADPKEMALLSLICHFLEQKGMAHTLSVFVAESRMEHSLAYPLSSVEAIKALGLQGVWNLLAQENGELSTDLLSLLQAIGHWVSAQSEKDAAAELQTNSKASISVQTDVETTPRSCDADSDLESNKENASVNQCKIRVKGLGSSKKIEQRLLEIEKACQQRMRQELDERLKLSAKKQAAYAAKRVESMHREAISSLRDQLEEERAQAKRRQEELIARMAQQTLLAQKDSREMDQRMQAMSLEKQTLQSELDVLNEKAKEAQKQRFKEWNEENEQLQSSRRDLQQQLNDVSMQKVAMKAKEMQLSALQAHRDAMLEEMQELRHEKAKALELQQLSFQEAQAKLERKYHNAQADLEASRSEVLGLRGLLQQSQAALGSLSFREVGKASAAQVSNPPVIYNKNLAGATAMSSHTGLRAPPGSGYNMVGPSVREPNSTKKDDTPLAGNNVMSVDACQLNDNTANVLSRAKQRSGIDIQPTIPEDPPCNSAEDPPEMKESSTNLKADTPSDDEQSDDDNSMNVVVGDQFILDVSGITEDVYSEKVSTLSKLSDDPVAELSDDKLEAKVDGAEEQDSSGECNAEKGTSETTSSPAAVGIAPSASDEEVKSDGDDVGAALENVDVPSSESNEINALSAASMASEAEYSERFHAFDEKNDQTVATQGSTKPAEEADVLRAYPESPNSASSTESSNGYTESFCSANTGARSINRE